MALIRLVIAILVYRKREVSLFLIVSCLLILADIPQFLWWSKGIEIDAIYSTLSLVINITLLTAWAFSIYQRILHQQLRLYLVWIAVLIIFWITIRIIKYQTIDLDWVRFYWYLYYLPIIFIPMLAFCIAFALGKNESFRFPKYFRIVFIVGLLLFLLVLTNDYHQLVFKFHDDLIKTDANSSYNIGYWIVLILVISLVIISISLIFQKSRVPHTRKIIWLPMVLLFIILVYTFLYWIKSPLIRLYFRDMTLFYCWFTVFVLSACIHTGLIPSNSLYLELFRFMSLRALITDKNSNLLLASEAAYELPIRSVGQVLKKPIIRDGYRISIAPITHGFVVWYDDVSELLSLISDLKLIEQELKESNALMTEAYQTEQKKLALIEKNHLYNLLQSRLKTQIQKLHDLSIALESTQSPELEKELVERIAVLTAYLKRRNNLIFIDQQDGFISSDELKYSFQESLVNLELSGITSHFEMDFNGFLMVKSIADLYDQFQWIIDACQKDLSSIYVKIDGNDTYLRMILMLHCSKDLHHLATKDLLVTQEGNHEWLISSSIRLEGMKP